MRQRLRKSSRICRPAPDTFHCVTVALVPHLLSLAAAPYGSPPPIPARRRSPPPTRVSQHHPYPPSAIHRGIQASNEALRGEAAKLRGDLATVTMERDGEKRQREALAAELKLLRDASEREHGSLRRALSQVGAADATRVVALRQQRGRSRGGGCPVPCCHSRPCPDTSPTPVPLRIPTPAHVPPDTARRPRRAPWRPSCRSTGGAPAGPGGG